MTAESSPTIPVTESPLETATDARFEQEGISARIGATALEAAIQASGPEPVEAPRRDEDDLDLLVRQAVEGDRQATSQLFRHIHPMVLNLCRARLGRQETVLGTADDVAQEVALAVVKVLPEYVPRGLSFRAFVYAIAAHKITDAFRAMGRNRSDPSDNIPDVSPDPANNSPEQAALGAELSAALQALMNQHLTPYQRQVLMMRIGLGFTSIETAAVCGRSVVSVRVTQHRALGRIRKVFAGQSAVTSADETSAEE